MITFSLDKEFVNSMYLVKFYKNYKNDNFHQNIFLELDSNMDLTYRLAFNITLTHFGSVGLLLEASQIIDNFRVNNGTMETIEIEEDRIIFDYNFTFYGQGNENFVIGKYGNKLKMCFLDRNSKQGYVGGSIMMCTLPKAIYEDEHNLTLFRAFKGLKYGNIDTSVRELYCYMEEVFRQKTNRDFKSYTLRAFMKEAFKNNKPILDDYIIGELNLLRKIRNFTMHNSFITEDKFYSRLKDELEKIMKQFNNSEERDLMQRVIKDKKLLDANPRQVVLDCLAAGCMLIKYLELDIAYKDYTQEEIVELAMISIVKKRIKEQQNLKKENIKPMDGWNLINNC